MSGSSGVDGCEWKRWYFATGMTDWHLLQNCPSGCCRTCPGPSTPLKDKHHHTDYLLSPVDCGRKKNNLYLEQFWKQKLTLQGIREDIREFGKRAQNRPVSRHGGQGIASVTPFLSADANHFSKPHLTPNRGWLQHAPSNFAHKQHRILCMFFWGHRWVSHFISTQRWWIYTQISNTRISRIYFNHP